MSEWLKQAGFSMREFKPPKPVLSKFMYDGDMQVLVGASGSGKSFLVIDIALSLTCKDSWHGKTMENRPVIFINGEGFGAILKRIKAYCIHHKINIDNSRLYFSETAADLFDDISSLKVLGEIKRIIDTWDSKENIKPVIIIDTVARNFGAGNESFTSDMSVFINHVDDIRKTYKATIILVHHTGHDTGNRARGSSALEAAADTVYFVKTDADGVMRVENKKSKDHEPPSPLSFKTTQIELPWKDEDGNSETSLVLELTDYTPPPKTAGLGKNQTRALNILKQLNTKQQQNLINSGFNPDDCRVTIQDWKNEVMASDIFKSGSRQDFYKLKEALSKRKAITVKDGYVYVSNV